MTSNITTIKRQLLNGIGYTDSLPMPLRATERYELFNEDQILKQAGSHFKLDGEREVLMATAQKFPLKDIENFELIVDDAFLAQHKGVELHSCHDFKVIFSDINHNLHEDAKFFIEINNCYNFTIEDIEIVGGRNIVVVNQSSHFQIKNCRIEKVVGYAIIIHNSSHFHVTHCLLKNNLASGVLVIGDSKHGRISDCQCCLSRGYFNFDAGIHFCATSEAITLAEIPELCHEEMSIEEKSNRPYGIVIENCLLDGNRAQGIYLEGAVNCLLRNNQIINNNKEGVCFDWGSCHNFFQNNLVSFNGERKDLSEEEIEADFISDYPMLEDGSSSMKLAGVSVDNGCANLFSNNRIANNYGGGIKLVRTALFNVIDKNFIMFNSLGNNRFMPYFYGVCVLGLGAINKEFVQNKTKLLDFLPSQLNTISNNIINGQFKVIYFDSVSTGNISNDNTVWFYHSLRWKIYFYLLGVKHYMMSLLK